MGKGHGVITEKEMEHPLIGPLFTTAGLVKVPDRALAGLVTAMTILRTVTRWFPM